MERPSPLLVPPAAGLPQRLVGGVLAVLLAALLLFAVLMQPPLGELRLMATFLALTAAGSVAAGYGAYRLGWLRRAPRLGWTLLGTYALASLLTFANVWVTARLMFASQHDLLLATVLLLFAGGIAMALGAFFSAALLAPIAALSAGARAIARGEQGVRVPVQGRDELAALASTFNEMAAQLERAAAEKAASERLRRDLIAWVGHDLRTPLASVRAVVEALADGVVEQPETVQRYLHTARRDIRALSRLIDDLFELSRLDAGGLELARHPASLTDLLSDALESFSALAAQRGIQLQGSAATGVDPVWLDAQGIARVLANLLSNALRHTPAGGTVWLRAAPTAGGVVVTVEDDGEGIAPAHLPHIFEQFYRGEPSRSRATGGAGLGLAIAQRLVLAHGGTITAEARAGGGTVVRFTLPRTAPP